MGSDLSAVGLVGTGAYEIGTSRGDAGPGKGGGVGVAAAGGGWEIGNWVIGTRPGNVGCAAMSIRTSRAIGSAACMPCGSALGDMASAMLPRQTAITRVRILFPMASLSVATGLIRSC